MISPCKTFGDEFAAALRQYLTKNNMVNPDGQLTLAKMSGKMLAEEVQRFFDWKCETLNKRVVAAANIKKKREAFVPPSPLMVEEYAGEIGYPMDGAAWCAHYEAKGWKISGSTKMSDWKAAVRKWKAMQWNPTAPAFTPKGKDLSIDIYKEPPNWKGAWRKFNPDDDLGDRQWADVRSQYGRKLIACMRRNGMET